MKVNGKKLQGELNLAEFVDVKGWKAMGNRVSDQLLTAVSEIDAPIISQLKAEQQGIDFGDTIELDVTPKSTLFD